LGEHTATSKNSAVERELLLKEMFSSWSREIIYEIAYFLFPSNGTILLVFVPKHTQTKQGGTTIFIKVNVFYLPPITSDGNI